MRSRPPASSPTRRSARSTPPSPTAPRSRRAAGASTTTRSTPSASPTSPRQVRAARELVAYAERLRESGTADQQAEEAAVIYAAEAAHALRSAVDAAPDDFGIADAAEVLDSAATRAAIRAGLDEARVRALGRRAIATNGVNNGNLEDETAALTRDAARDFARNEVAPIAQQIHREDLLVPDDLIEKFAAQGFFGSSIPEEYGGTGMGYLPMVVMTEELSAASLGAAGSLHTRPEILAHALQTGGTEAQKQEWLPKLASGEVLVAIGVTEPDVGSDNANLQCRATPAEVDGRTGWRLNGAKGVEHLLGSCQRDRDARAHQPERRGGRARALRLHRPQGPALWLPSGARPSPRAAR